MTQAPEKTAAPLLEVDELSVEFLTEQGPARAVEGVSFALEAGEVVGLVGESGCGKSATALALMGLLPQPTGRVSGGRIAFEGQDLVRAKESTWRTLRGNRLSMIFQEPMTALNPVLTSGEQVAEVLRRHRGLGRKAAWQRAVALFEEVGIPAPERRVKAYPHQLSGGMRQRVIIAMAIACEPALLIADEPTTALDVTIQAQILSLLGRLRERSGQTLLLITHDLGVVAQVCQRVLVMYAGRLVEEAPVAALFASPRHPYTAGLMRSLPKPPTGGEAPGRLEEIPGMVPPITDRPAGCGFAERCQRVRESCRAALPPLQDRAPDHRVRCLFPRGGESRGEP